MSGGGDHAAFAAFARRILRAMARRCADADPEDLAELLAVSRAADEAVRVAVGGMRARGVSWAEIARPLGMTRQAAQQRWGVNPGLTPDRVAAGGAVGASSADVRSIRSA